MRKVLVIDNDTGAMSDIQDALKREYYEIVHFKKFRIKQVKGFTHIILTGGDYWATQKKFSEEAKLIKSCPAKILGICFGMQLIAKVYGSSLKHLDKVRKGNLSVNILKSDLLFKEVPRRISVFQYHGYVISKLGKDLEVLAESKDGIESIRHKSLPIWGVQFHPEVVYKEKKDGRKIIKQFLSL